MNIFADLHHYDLYYSLQLLFEKRLGHNLYRPIGISWFTEGYWKIAEPYGNNEGTVRQYLDLNTLPWDPYENVNGGSNNYQKDGIYYIWNPIHKLHQKAITLEMFKEMDIDIVISSIPSHDKSFAELIRVHKPKAKHISQMGNIYQTTDVKNVMCSTIPYPVPPDKNVVFYHQEFNLEVFNYEKPKETKAITSFVNLLPRADLYQEYKKDLPEFTFKAYGSQCPDGTITGDYKVAEIMRNSTFGWHIKPHGDGFGHILHNWYAVGRPVITNAGDYFGKTGMFLLEDKVTCIDLERHSKQENLETIRHASVPEVHQMMCEAAIDRFKSVVNYDEEEKKIRQFLSNVT